MYIKYAQQRYVHELSGVASISCRRSTYIIVIAGYMNNAQQQSVSQQHHIWV
jgi:hypothetical protein